MQEIKVSVISNGCPRRNVDASRIIKYFELNSCSVTRNPQEADYIILVTCSFKKSKEKESLNLIKKLKKYRAELIVGGCLPPIAPHKFKQHFQGRSFSTKNLEKIEQLFTHFKIKWQDVPDGPCFPSPLLVSIPLFPAPKDSQRRDLLIAKFFKEFEFSKPFLLKCLKAAKKRFAKQPPAEQAKAELIHLRIGDGCLGDCTYCSIHKAIGGLKSRPLDICLAEYKRFLDEGYRNFLIVAADTGAYGLDINSSFPELLDRLSCLDRDLAVRWYLTDFHPRWVIEYRSKFPEKIRQGKIVYLLSPIQSASRRILQLMNRHTEVEAMEEAFCQFRQANTNIKLVTQLIVGFPSESRDDFWDSLNFVKRVGFNHVYLFPYYDGENTVASKLDNKLEEKEIKKRIKQAADFFNKEKIAWSCDDI